MFNSRGGRYECCAAGLYFELWEKFVTRSIARMITYVCHRRNVKGGKSLGKLDISAIQSFHDPNLVFT